ncbi:MAG: response regulator [Deltaproteobacteria bacterium]|nr:response regulator [Deltaproteobacteria bacterium]
MSSERKYRSLFEDSKDGIFIAQVDGALVDVNQSFLDLFGYEREEMQGKNVIMTNVDPSDGVGFMSEIQNYGYVKDYPLDLRKKDGSFMNCLLTGTVRRNEDGTIEGYRGIIRDITVQRSLEMQLLQAQKMEAVGTLAGGIAHDFNNILQAVLGYSELMLLRKDDQDRDYSHLKKIQQAGQRGADLVKSLLMFSRKIETTKVSVNLNLEILQAQDILSHTIPKIIKIDLRLSENLESIQADPSQINQILMNLGINARDAMPNGGTLIFETANVGLDKEYCASHVEIMPGNYVQLTVSDTGQGMDNRTLEHIFEPFFTTKEKGKGTGLGLATVFGIVKRHGGHIICLSELGHGTTFKIYFPATQVKKGLAPSASVDAMQGGAETILLVDDEESLRDLGTTILNNFGYEVITACNGKEALAIYRKHKNKISLILLDLIMPEMDGRQCLAEILLIDPKAKILVASGYSENGQANDVAAAGAKGFVEKPYNMKKLLITVREALDEN